MLASCTTSLSLCKSFSKNSFFFAFYYLHRYQHKLQVAFVLESGCKGIAFFDTMQDFRKEKCNIYVDFNTCLHNMQPFVGAHIVLITREREG